MEKKYHIGKNGKPSICKAQIKCRLSAESEHFPSIEKAQEYLDKSNELQLKIAGIETNSFNKIKDSHPQLFNFLNKLEVFGGESYFVGGFVRDMLLGKDSKDIDIEIHKVSIDDFKQKAKDNNIKVDLVGESFGVFKAKLDNEEIDLSFPRTEVLTGNSHTDFDVSVDPFIGEDKAVERRDFTINSLM